MKAKSVAYIITSRAWNLGRLSNNKLPLHIADFHIKNWHKFIIILGKELEQRRGAATELN